jgi:arsenate reductase
MMAEAFGRVIGHGVFESYSAGTEERDRINQDAVRLMKELGIDMELIQKPKLLNQIPDVDIAIKMGCNVVCPVVFADHVEDWGLDDPSGLDDVTFRQTRDSIREKVMDLVLRIKAGEI